MVEYILLSKKKFFIQHASHVFKLLIIFSSVLYKYSKCLDWNFKFNQTQNLILAFFVLCLSTSSMIGEEKLKKL